MRTCHTSTTHCDILILVNTIRPFLTRIARRHDVDARCGNIDPITIIGKGCTNTIIVGRRHGNNIGMVSRIILIIRIVISRSKDDQHIMCHGIVNSPHDCFFIDIRSRKAPGIGTHGSSVIHRIDQCFGKTTGIVFPKSHTGHESNTTMVIKATTTTLGSTRHTRYSNSVIGIGRNGTCTMTPMTTLTQ